MNKSQIEERFREERENMVRMVKGFVAHKNSLPIHAGNRAHIQRLEEQMEKSLQDYIIHEDDEGELGSYFVGGKTVSWKVSVNPPSQAWL